MPKDRLWTSVGGVKKTLKRDQFLHLLSEELAGLLFDV